MTIKLEAKKREITGKKLFSLRQAGKIPAVLYGHGAENLNLELDGNKFEKVYSEAGENTILDLAVEGLEPMKVLVADTQYDPIKQRLLHVDLHKIRMDEKVNANVKLKFIGESPAVKSEGGVLVHSLSELEIRCLPNDLIHEIDVDISVLKTFDDVITLKDLNLPKTVEVVGHELDEVIATVNPPRAEAEEAPAVAAAEGEKTAEGEAKEEGKTGEENPEKK